MDRENLWTSWAKRNLVRRHNFWVIGFSCKDSRIWKALLKLRGFILQNLNVSSAQASSGQIDLSSLIKKNGKMDCGAVYDIFKPHPGVVDWCPFLWQGIQSRRWSFHCWLATLQRLPTASRLYRYGIINNDTCVLCGLSSEDEEYLWFR